MSSASVFSRGSDAVRDFLQRGAIAHVEWPRTLILPRDASWVSLLIMDDDFGLQVVFHLKKHTIKGEDGRKDRDVYVRIPCNIDNHLDATCCLCEEGRNKYPGTLLTVFNPEGYHDKGSDKTYPMLKRLWIVDPSLAVPLLALRDAHGSFRGMGVRTRITDSSRYHSSGDEVELIGVRPPEKWPGIATQFGADPEKLTFAPFHYDGFVRPWTNDQMRAFLAGHLPDSPQAQKDADA